MYTAPHKHSARLCLECPSINKMYLTFVCFDFQNVQVFGGEDNECTDRDHDGGHLYGQVMTTNFGFTFRSNKKCFGYGYQPTLYLLLTLQVQLFPLD